jgi:hypothetical protein
MNGAISKDEFVATQRRYQVMTAGLMAIEALTGVVTPKSVVLRGESAASTGKNIIEAEKNLKEANDNLKAAEDESKKAASVLDEARKAQQAYEQEHPDANARTDEQKKRLKEFQEATAAAQKEADKKVEAEKSKNSIVEEMQALLDASRSLRAKSSTGGKIDSASCSRACTPFSEANNAKFLSTVQGIVSGMFAPDVLYECIGFYRDRDTRAQVTSGQASASVKELDQFCQSVFAQRKESPEKNRPLPFGTN